MMYITPFECSYHNFSTSEDASKIQTKTGNKFENFN